MDVCQAQAVWTGAWGPGLRGCGQMWGAHGCFMDHESATCSVRWSRQLAGHLCEFPSQVPLCGRPTGWFLFCWNVTRPSLDSQTGLHGALCARVPPRAQSHLCSSWFRRTYCSDSVFSVSALPSSGFLLPLLAPPRALPSAPGAGEGCQPPFALLASRGSAPFNFFLVQNVNFRLYFLLCFSLPFCYFPISFLFLQGYSALC